mgnify:FL=1|jgi:hypothetical protein
MITCIKNLKTKKGLKFIKGKQYKWDLGKRNSVKIYFDDFKTIRFKNENTFDKYFKF